MGDFTWLRDVDSFKMSPNFLDTESFRGDVTRIFNGISASVELLTNKLFTGDSLGSFNWLWDAFKMSPSFLDTKSFRGDVTEIFDGVFFSVEPFKGDSLGDFTWRSDLDLFETLSFLE